MKIIITKGIPASGKSTWALEKLKTGQGKWKHINKDTLRLMLDGVQWSKEKEKFVEHACDVLLMEALAQGFNVIIDDTNLHPKHEAKIREIATHYCDTEVEVKWFPITLKEAHRRNKRREARVPDAVIERMHQQYIDAGGPDCTETFTDPTPVYNPDLPDCIVIDLDGTLALFEHHRGPFEGEKCGDDAVNQPVLQIIRSIQHSDRDVRVILLSGRDGEFRSQTEEFLKKNHIEYDELFMRKAGDCRNDAIIKRELYELHIRDKYTVGFILDDRDRVVAMWRNLGLTCLQVAYGKF